MELRITIKRDVIKIRLEENGRKIDGISFPDEHNLGRKLLPQIEKLLKRNKLSSSDIAKTVLDSDISDNFTTRRIAEAVANAFNWKAGDNDSRARG